MNRSLSGLIIDANIFLSGHLHEAELSLDGLRVLMKHFKRTLLWSEIYVCQAITCKLNEMVNQPKDP